MATLTPAQQQALLTAGVATFNGSLGVTYMNQIAPYGAAIPQLYNDLAASAAFQNQSFAFSSASTTAQFSTAFANQLIGASGVNVTAANWTAAELYMEGLVNSSGRGAAMYAAVTALQAVATTDSNWGNAAALLTNRVAVATDYTINQSGNATSISALQATIATVTSAASSVTAAIATNSGASGQTFTLSTGADNIVGTSGNDTINGFLDATAAAPQTFTSADTINGNGGTDVLNITVSGTTAALAAANISNVETVNVRAAGVALAASDLSTIPGLTTFNVDRSTAGVTVTNLAAGATFGVLGDNSTTGAGAFALGYADAATVAALNISGGVKGTDTVTLTGTNAKTLNITSGGLTNLLDTITAAVPTTVTIGGTADLAKFSATTSTGTTGLTLTAAAATKLTATGSGNYNLSGAALNNVTVTIDASAMTAGGLKVVAGNSTTLKFTGGAGNDSLALGAALVTGAAVDGGTGTDTLVVAGNTAFVAAAPSAFIKGFEILDVTTATVDVDAALSATNTFTGLRIGGSATLSNVNSAMAGATTVYADATPVIGVKGATTPGQLDTVKLTVDDGLAASSTVTITAPTLTGVEQVNIVATDKPTITSLANALAITGMTITGAGATTITTTAIALNPNTVIDASGATGSFTFDATGATANGPAIKGSSGANTITGGSAAFSVDLSKSAAKADTVFFTNATGTSIAVPDAITGFTNATTTGDKLNLENTGVVKADVAAGTATGIANLTASVVSGVMTFAGTAAATATLTDKVTAAFSANFITNGAWNYVVFEHSGSTYLCEDGDGTTGYVAADDWVIQLVGLTGVTAASAAASAANTVYAV